jgi:DNA-3-methyladenine glycosylase II
VNTYEFTIVPQGFFDLAALATFGFGDRIKPAFDGVMRMAFVPDDLTTSVGVEVTQPSRDAVVVRASSPQAIDSDSVQGQVARILSLDHDGAAFAAVVDRDPVLRALHHRAPGLRPPLFHSPYEAAAWSVLSARRSAAQMSKVRGALAARCGVTFSLAGQTVASFPTPTQLLSIDAHPGIDATKMERLHSVARAALDGVLDIERLHQLGPEAATVDLQQIVGIGPFYASLIVIRACGFADGVVGVETRSLAIARQLYNNGPPMSPKDFGALSEQWRPFRIWATVLLRAVGSRNE